MVSYNLTHLTQDDSQNVAGPIQDDEALFLYSIIQGMRLKRVFEIGGLNGYSATNFLRAVGKDGVVYTCDLNPVPRLADNHIVLTKNAASVTPADLHNMPLEFIFFDCHEYNVQMQLYHSLKDFGLITPHTVIGLHDTNTHPFKAAPWAYATSQGYVHQKVERDMVNDFVRMGYHAFCLHTRHSKHSDAFPLRHGVTIMTEFKPLLT